MRPARRSVDISVPPPQHRASALGSERGSRRGRCSRRAQQRRSGQETTGLYRETDVVHLWVIWKSHPRRRLPGVLDVVFACAAASSLR
jgi:hypothetical protein